MTDEEKAEEYAEKITDIVKGRTILPRSELNQRFAGIVQGVLYGLAEGRKETAEKISEVEKENAELKAQNEKMKNFYNCAHSSRALCPNGHKCAGCIDWELDE